jgi:tetratricopeptide (TPR) repeat protein
LGPSIVGKVDDDPEKVAEKYGAKIVVYGDIVKNARGQLEITPRFYVDPNAFADAAEITGASKLGSAIQVNTPPNALTVQQVLSSRTTALAYVIVGLSKYVAQDYAGAQDAFNSALNQPDLDIDQGGQAVRVLLGSTYKKLASLAVQRGDRDTARAQLEQAIIEYTTVQEQTPEYARAYVGLAAATDLKWNLARQQDDSTPKDLLEEALTYLDQAERSADQPHFIFQVRALYTQMQVEYHLWAYYPSESTAGRTAADLQTDIQRLANRIIDAYDAGSNPALQDVAAEAYGYRGLVYFGLGDCMEAIPEYEQARTLSTENERIMTFSEWLGDCYAETGQNDKAVEAYTRARDLAQSIEGMAPSIGTYYQGKIDELSGRG